MRRLPIYLLIDTSGSMRDEPIAAVNAGLASLLIRLRQDPLALETVFLSIITFDDSAREVVPLTDLVSFQLPELTVDRGLTALGAALELTASRIAKRQRNDWKPLVFLLTDGEPTDDWQKGVAAIKRAAAGFIVACAAGPDCDTYVLGQLTKLVVRLDSASTDSLLAYVDWVSESVTAASQSLGVQSDAVESLGQLPDLPAEVVAVTEFQRPAQVGQAGPYTPFKGQNAIRAANKDRYGNPDGPQYDLARDGAFAGHQIAIIHLYTGEGFDFELPRAALEEKGFRVLRWAQSPPSPAVLQAELARSCQLWLTSDLTQKLERRHLGVIREFFDSGRGVYIWGDNDPFYADANLVTLELFGITMSGNRPGNTVVQLQDRPGRSGLVPGHPVSTGLEHLYEGDTIAEIDLRRGEHLTPLVHGSEGQVVVAAYEHDGRRAIIDGGFTRLYTNWDTAGTGRYVKNAAAWLFNYERFGLRAR